MGRTAPVAGWPEVRLLGLFLWTEGGSFWLPCIYRFGNDAMLLWAVNDIYNDVLWTSSLACTFVESLTGCTAHVCRGDD